MIARTAALYLVAFVCILVALSAGAYAFVWREYASLLAPALTTPEGAAALAVSMRRVFDPKLIVEIDVPLVLAVAVASYALARAAIAPGTISASTLTMAGGAELTGTGTLNDITIPVGSDLLFTPNSSDSQQTLEGTITNNGTIELLPNANGNVIMPFSGKVTLAGTGIMQFDQEVSGNYVITYATSGSTVTNAAGHTIHCLGPGYFGGYGDGTVINQGLLEADGADNLYVNSAAFTNTGTCEAINKGDISIFASTNNSNGLITSDGSSTIGIFGTTTGGAITLADGGTLVNGNTANGNNYPGTISGTTLTLAGGAQLTGTGTLNNITLPVGSNLLIVGSTNGTNQTVSGTLTDDGMVELQPNPNGNVEMMYSGSVTLAGTGVMQLDPEVNGNYVTNLVTTGSTVTNAAGHTIKSVGGGANFGDYNSGTVINNGTLEAEGSGNSLTLDPSLITNQSIIQASNGATVVVDGGSYFENYNSATLDNTAGTISIDASTLVNDGTIQGGPVDLTNGSTLENGLAAQSINPGIITGSTLSLTSGSSLIGYGTLSNITVPAGSELNLAEVSNQTITGILTVQGVLNVSMGTVTVNDASLEIDGSGVLLTSPTATLQVGGNLLGQTQNAQAVRSARHRPPERLRHFHRTTTLGSDEPGSWQCAGRVPG